MKKKIIICHIVNRLDIGGMENGIVNLANNIDKNKFEFFICCICGEGNIASRLNKEIKLFNLNEKEGLSFIKIVKLTKVLRKIKPDIVHTHGWGGGSLYGIIGSKLAKISFIVNGEHGTFFLKNRQILVQRIIYKLCNFNLAVSDHIRKKAVEYFKVRNDKFFVIKNGVDNSLFSGSYKKELMIERFANEGINVSKSTFNVFMVGSLKLIKGQYILLKTINLLKQNNEISNIRFFFIGEGPEKEFLINLCKYYNIDKYVYFLGERNDVYNILSIADILISHSLYEGFSNVILEAMSSGVSVIATINSGKEIINGGLNGILISFGDFYNLRHYILKLKNNSKFLDKLSLNSRRTIEKKFTIKKMIDNYEQFYIKIIEGNI